MCAGVLDPLVRAPAQLVLVPKRNVGASAGGASASAAGAPVWMLEWLVDDDNRELEDEIEAVNFRMLDKLLSTSSLIAVFFCTVATRVTNDLLS